ncbi:hypothetical protein RB2150_15056 [Rhodobacteraceae bacterium HTCC2150]|nr:hypothetical protein RB2150_15056 [Rhodobacteraceae bacterium HTCC2150]
MTLNIITHPSLAPLRHGFFTRKGGASSGVFSGLNCGLGSSDQREVVMLNRARVAEAMNVPALASVYQVHSADVVVVHDPSDAEGIKADAMVCNAPDVALGILTADCQPVLFADVENHVIGAAHAGWKGALNGVMDATVEKMIGLGAQRENIVGVIGPSISQKSYEVGAEFLDDFMYEDDQNTRFFANGQKGKYQFDLPGYGLHRLRAAGIKSAKWTGHCTYSDPNLFYSYRRTCHENAADYGRLISTISL